MWKNWPEHLLTKSKFIPDRSRQMCWVHQEVQLAAASPRRRRIHHPKCCQVCNVKLFIGKKYNTKDICDANIVKILVKINRSFFDTQFFYIIYGSLYQIEKVEFLLSDSLIFSDAGLMKHPLLWTLTLQMNCPTMTTLSTSDRTSSFTFRPQTWQTKTPQSILTK